MNPISLESVATLEVSAASGCVVKDGRVYVVADDDPHLWGFSIEGARVERLRLLHGALPTDAKARKAVKPDFEALAALPDGSLFALGSGSTARRRKAALVKNGHATVIDCTPLFVVLEQQFDALNLEAAVVVGDQLVLGQRGNGPGSQNALIRLGLQEVLMGFTAGELPSVAIEGIDPLELGKLEGVPLSLTDLTLSLDGRVCFSAAAEDTDDPYEDGACTGSVVGELSGNRVLWQTAIDQVLKIEGLAQYDANRWVMVADADDPSVPAKLLVAPAKAMARR